MECPVTNNVPWQAVRYMGCPVTKNVPWQADKCLLQSTVSCWMFPPKSSNMPYADWKLIVELSQIMLRVWPDLSEVFFNEVTVLSKIIFNAELFAM